MSKIIPFLIVFLLLAGCASSPSRSISSDSILNSCQEMMKNFFALKSSDELAASDKKIIVNDAIEPSFTKMLSNRLALREKYERVIESIKDFNPKADPAILGKAKLLIDPQEAYLTKILMIRQAKYSIDVSYYIFHNDESAQMLLHEIRLAIKRGVKVRIMLDSLGSATNAPFYHQLRALTELRGGLVRNLNGQPTQERAKAEVVIINPLFNIRAHVSNWFKSILNLFVDAEKAQQITFSMNRRSHDKILMIDAFSPKDSMAVVGGRNIANYYYALDPDGKETFQDLEILLRGIAEEKPTGEVHNALENYYNRIFYYTANKNLQNFLFPITNSGVREELKKMRAGQRKLLNQDGAKLKKKLDSMKTERFLEDGYEEGMISIVHELQNLSRTKAFYKPLGEHNPKNGNSLMDKLDKSMRKAKKSIDLVSPYLWLSDDDIAFLKKWLAEDSTRTLRVISNSISTTDNVPAQAMVDTILGPKLVSEVHGQAIAKQIQVFSYGRLDDSSLGGDVAYGKLHAKFAIIDDSIALVGTSNLDPRSRYLNSELGVFFEGSNNEVTARELKGYFNQLADKSYLWGSKEWEEVREHDNNRIAIAMQVFAGKILHFFKLVPLI